MQMAANVSILNQVRSWLFQGNSTVNWVENLGPVSEVYVDVRIFTIFICATGTEPPSNWPSRGEIKIEDISVRYAENLPPVIQNVTLHVRPGEKVSCREVHRMLLDVL